MIPAEALAALATLGLSLEQASTVAAMLRAVEDATRSEAPDVRTALQKRNARYYEARKDRLKSTEIKTEATEIKTTETVLTQDETVLIKTSTRAEPILSKVEASQKKESKRGTRLPLDFVPSEAVWNLGVELLGEAKAKLQLESFRDHWAHKPGAGGVGLDWHAAFRKWLRKAAEWSQPARAGPSAISHINGHSDPEKSIHAALRRIRENLSEPSDDGPIQSLLSNQSR